MPCSFCKFAGHNVTTCQSTVLLNEFNNAVRKVEIIRKEPNTHKVFYSNAAIFKDYISSMDLSMRKGIAGKLGINISRRNVNVLVALIVRKMYFYDTVPDDSMLIDIIYYRFLQNIIETNIRNAIRDFFDNVGRNADLIKQQIRAYNIAILRDSVDYYNNLIYGNFHDISEELCAMMIIVNREPNGIQRWFGSFITLEDVFQYIPNLRSYLVRDYSDDMLDQLIETIYNASEEGNHFEDVVLKQSLDLTCEYVKKNVAHETTKQLQDTEECIICYSGVTCDTVLNCGHTYCIDCVITTVKLSLNDHRKKLTCPMCRADMKHVQSTNEREVYNLADLLR